MQVHLYRLNLHIEAPHIAVFFYFYGLKVISTNIGSPTKFEWKGKTEVTGIFKRPVEHPVILETDGVATDTIADRKVHGGIHKACYLFSAEQYPYWQHIYPQLDWDWGMFGENLTVGGLDEAEIRIGDIYKIGTAIVQISQPREPCYKLGIRFGNQEILRQFINRGYPGTYVRLLESGKVTTGDTVHLIEPSKNPLTIKQFYELLFARVKDQRHLQLALQNASLPECKREKLRRYLKKGAL
ncbi:MAG TPA: MOSC domain-containing protein [Eudoraea sp.]|nr:MOSC domain-containing protein [Eudoraea sp.]